MLATQLGNTNQVMPGYDSVPADTQKQLNVASDIGNAFIFAFAGHVSGTHPELLLRYVRPAHDALAARAYVNLLALSSSQDTTGHTLTWLTYELAKNPSYQERIVAEVDAFWEEVGDRECEFLDMQKLPFMTRCIMETLRLWPVVPNGTFRQLSYDDEVTAAHRGVHLPHLRTATDG